MFARIDNGKVVEVGQPPDIVLTPDHDYDMRLHPDGTPFNLAAWETLGWVEVAETAPPTVGPTETVRRTAEMVDGVPTLVWVVIQRPDDLSRPPQTRGAGGD
jgi:ABC-type proline/glycine betaine transport system ATPase subunit